MLFLNYDEIPLLSILVFSPLLGAFIITRIHPQKYTNIKNCSLWVNAFAFFMASLIFMCTNGEYRGIQFSEQLSWIAYDNINYYVGISYNTLIIILLFTGIFPVATILSLKESTNNCRQRMTLLLCMESCALLCLCSINIILFYISYEATFFCFLFFLQISSKNSNKINLLLLQHLICSSILMIIFLKILYNIPNFSLETVQYELTNVQLDSITNSVLTGVLVLTALPVDYKSNKTNADVFIHIVPLQISRIHIIFTLYPFVTSNQNNTSTLFLIASIMFVLCMSFIKTYIHIKQCNFERVVYGVAQAIMCFVLIDLSLNSALINKILFINFCLDIAGIYLILSIFNQKSKMQTLALPYLLFSCFGSPCLCYVPTLRKIIMYNSITIGVTYVVSILVFVTIGCHCISMLNSKQRRSDIF